MFIARVHDPISKETMKQIYTSFQTVYAVALDFEVIQQNNGSTKPTTVAAFDFHDAEINDA